MYLTNFLNLHLFKPKTSKTTTHIHGVFVRLEGKGVLIIGKSGIGKSEIALDLIHKGHALISDDSVVFYKKDKTNIIGEAPSIIRNLIEVRGLGVLDIKKLFGSKSISLRNKLSLVIELKPCQNEMPYSRLEMHIGSFNLFGIAIPKIELPVNQTRHVSLLIETAVKNYALLSKGSSAIKDLSKKMKLQLSLDH
jgi:HPr kinase/phosphorylase